MYNAGEIIDVDGATAKCFIERNIAEPNCVEISKRNS